MTTEIDSAAAPTTPADTVCVLTVLRGGTLDHLSVHGTDDAADAALRQHVVDNWDSYWTGPLRRPGHVSDTELAHHLNIHSITARIENLPVQ